MTEKKIGSIEFRAIPESIKAILKIKEDAYLGNFSKSFCQENKINPEDLKFNVLKNSKNKIRLAQIGTEQTESENHTQQVRVSNVT